jgi:hypothetical protein
MPQDAFVSVQGSYETYDGFSHPEVVVGADGEVVVREAAEPEDWVDEEYDGQPSEHDEWMSFDPDC